MADLTLNIPVELDWSKQDRIDTGTCLVTNDYDVYTVSATVMRDGAVMDCSAYTARIRFLREDDVAVGESLCTVDKTMIVAPIPNVAFNVRGTVTAEISLYDGTVKRRTLQPFLFSVRPSIDTDGTIDPVDTVLAIDQMLNEAQEAIDNKTQEAEESMGLLLEEATTQANIATTKANQAAAQASNATALVDRVEALLDEVVNSGVVFDAVIYNQETGYLRITKDGKDVVDPCRIDTVAFDSITYNQETGELHITKGGTDVADPCLIDTVAFDAITYNKQTNELHITKGGTDVADPCLIDTVAFDAVSFNAETGYLHVTKEGKDVIPPCFIDISNDGLAFDAVSYNQETGYLHITMEGTDVVDPCFIGGLTFDGMSYNADTGYLHITMEGKDVIEPCLVERVIFDAMSYDQETGYLHIQKEGEDIVDPCFIGGGGGASASTVVKLENLTGSTTIPVAFGQPAVLSYSYHDYDSNGDVTNSAGTLELFINNVNILTQNIEQGNRTLDVGTYLVQGINKVKIKVTDEDGNYGTKTWTVNAVAISISATFDDAAINTGALLFRYTPVGNNLEKTIHFLVDGREVATATVTASNRQQLQSIPAQSHGAHRLKVYATATVSGVTVTSNILEYDVIWAAAGNTTPIIACSFTGKAKQYSTVSIPYIVYSPLNLTSAITLAIDGNVVSTLTVDRTRQIWAYKPETMGTKTLTITCGSVVKTISLEVEGIGIDIEPVTTGLVFDLNPAGHTNNDTDREEFGYLDASGVNHPLVFSDNFDWHNGGFQLDAEGNTYFCVKCGTWVKTDSSLFTDDAMRNGKELKFVFKATNCRDYDAKAASCMADGIGLTIQAQKALVKSEQTTMEVPYCEDSMIEMDVNIEPDSKDRVMMVWLEGVPSKVEIYAANDNFTQSTSEPLTIGSNDCDVHIYRIKAYENDLTQLEIHGNWIADAPSAEENLERYTRNNIYDANGNIDMAKLAEVSPDLRIILVEADRMTTAKSDKVPCKVTHTFKTGGTTHCFTANNVEMKAQGTSSVQYGEAALNLDLSFKEGFSFEDGTQANVYTMTDNSIGVNYFNIKLNVASSENANNVVLADEYNNYQPYLNPARAANPKVRDTVEGHPCVVFYHNTSNVTVQVGAISVPPDTTILYGCGDMNNSKKNLEVFGQGGNDNQCCVELLNNTSNNTLWKSDDLSQETWDGDGNFEFRYPEEPTDEMKAAWQRVLSWVVSTDRTAATGDALPIAKSYNGVTYTNDTAEYRGAKFVAEFEDYFIKDSALYHYLFTERHAMVDNRAKNVFVSTDDGIHWDFTKDYDNDTADGNDNEGGLTLSYGMEDTDTIGAKDVFNASGSVIWCNIRDLMYDDLRTLFLDLESKGAWDAKRILAKYTEHQRPRPEALVIEDMWKKYIRPYTNSGTHAYLEMMYGTKADQRRQFETYQEKYIASKYMGTAATSDAITFRAYTPNNWGGVAPNSNITVTPYADMYVVIKSGSGVVRQRAKRGTAYTLTCPVDTLNDTEIYLYGASNISDVGDLAPLYVGYFNISSAIKLRHLKLGDGTRGYSNTNATTIGLGNNILLETLDIRNCPNLNQTLDLTGCVALISLEAVGSGITGVSFAPGGKIQTAHLPAVNSLFAMALRELQELTFASYNNLRTLRIEECATIDTLGLVKNATGLTRIRLLGIDWMLQNTDMLDRLVALTGLDENGYNLEISVLAGKVFVPIMRQAKLATYQDAWTDLAITYETLIQQYLVTFVNWDNTLLWQTYVDRGSDVADPVATGIIEAPTRASTISTVYTYDGWDADLTTIIAPRTITAKYAESVRMYTVRWYSQVGIVMDTQTVGYGSEAVYTGQTPERTDEEAQFVYYLFNGWDKSTGFIKGDTDVWAVWQRGELPRAGTDISAMTPAEICAVVKSKKASEYFSLKDRVNIQFGYAPEYTNITFRDVANNLVLDGSTYRDTGIQLLKNDAAWTIVADMQFDEATPDQTMLCCFEEDGFMGFKVRYVNGPSVQWGTMSLNSGATTYREIMVIRHEEGSKNVKVYSSKAYDDNIVVQELTKTTNTQTNASLILGATKTDAGNIGDYAKGTIHSCRIWNGDLGDVDCRKLVSWPREVYTFEVGGFNKYKLTANSIQFTNVDFVCAGLLERPKQMNTTDSNAGGWSEMPLRAWMQNRLYKGFPDIWRLMMQQCRINYNKYVDGMNSEIGMSNDYIWVPAYAEMQSTITEPWPYEGDWVTFFTNDQTRIKFKGFTLPDGYRTITSGTDPTTTDNTIKEGDLWINSANQSRGYYRHKGAWIPAEYFWLRGASVMAATNFCSVSYGGYVGANDITANGNAGICSRFSI